MENNHGQELSFRSIALGIFLAIVMGAANAYLGLKIGMTVTASIPAAMLAILVLRGICKTGTIFESNLVQTAASCGSDLGTGIIFTMPALIFIGFWQRFDYKMVTLVALCGGLLGILFMIPMRKVFITGKYKDLPYPEAHATVAVMKTGYQEKSGIDKNAFALIYGAIFGSLAKIMISFLGLIKSPLEFATSFFGKIFYIGGDLSPALIGIGFIVRIKISIMIFLGAFIAWGILLPIFSSEMLLEGNILDIAYGIWSKKIRFVGVGAMMIGGILSIIHARSGISHALKEIFGQKEKNTNKDSLEKDIPAKLILLFSMISIGILIYVYYTATNNITVTAIAIATMVILSFFFTSVANYIVAIVGSSNSPVSGMNISAVIITGILLVVLGATGISGMVATLFVASVICAVTCMAGDSCNELKIGHLIGASPFRQQIMCIIGMAASSFFIAPIMNLLHENTPGGIGGRELAAPQAALLASLAKGLFSPEGSLPWGLIFLGMGIAALIALIDYILSIRNSSIRLPVMPVAVGLYLPAPISIPILTGSIIAWFVSHDKDEKVNEHKMHRGILFSSGFIAGESIVGVLIAILVSLGLPKIDFALSTNVLSTTSVFGAIILITIFYYYTRYKK